MSKKPHSVKVPTQYRATAKILKTALQQGKPIRALIAQERHARIGSLQAVLKIYSDNRGAVDDAIEKSGLLTDNPNLDACLAKVLVTELIFGRKLLNGNSRPVETVRNYQGKLLEAVSGSGYKKKGRFIY